MNLPSTTSSDSSIPVPAAVLSLAPDPKTGESVPWFVPWAESVPTPLAKESPSEDDAHIIELEPETKLEIRTPGHPSAVPVWNLPVPDRLERAAREQLCWVCGESMASGRTAEHYRKFLVSSRELYFQRAAHPPMHGECGTWWAATAGRRGMLGTVPMALLTVRLQPAWARQVTRTVPLENGGRVWDLTNVEPDAVALYQAGDRITPTEMEAEIILEWQTVRKGAQAKQEDLLVKLRNRALAVLALAGE